MSRVADGALLGKRSGYGLSDLSKLFLSVFLFQFFNNNDTVLIDSGNEIILCL